MFTKAMLDALSKGAVHTQERLSLRQVKDSTADLIHELQNAPRPVVLSPDQSEGDVADIPFFPNPPAEEERARRAEAERLRQVEEKAQVRQAGQFTYPSRNQSSLTPEEIATTPNQSLPLAQLSQMKNSKEQWLAEAFKLLEAGFYEQALDILDHILMLDSNLAYAQSARGLALYHLNFYPAALTSLDLALTLNPKDVTAHYGRGLVLERLQRFADALSAFQQVTQLDANYVQAWRKMGAMLSELKRYEEALAAYEKILQLDRHDYDAYMGKRKVIRLLGRLE